MYGDKFRIVVTSGRREGNGFKDTEKTSAVCNVLFI